MRNTWTPREERDASLLWAMGVKRDNAARILGRHPVTLQVKMTKMGIKRPIQWKTHQETFQVITYRKFGLRWLEIARRLGVHKSVPQARWRTVERRILRKGGKRVTTTRKDTSAPKSDNEKMRPCMLCRKKFLSSWAGERYCGPCRNSSAFRDANGSIEAQYG